jgi:hypothetical protein
MTKISNKSEIRNLIRNDLSGTVMNVRFTKKGVVYAVTMKQRKKESKSRKK